MDWLTLIELLLFLFALLFGYLARTAKYVWGDRRATVAFAIIAMISTVSFLMLILFYY